MSNSPTPNLTPFPDSQIAAPSAVSAAPAAPAPASTATPTVNPNLQGLEQAGQRSIQQAQDIEKTENQPVPAVSAEYMGPHARLVRMVQGLTVGLQSMAQSVATGGREGGPAAVQAYQAKQQEIAQAKQNQLLQQRNAEIQQKLAAMQTTEAVMHTYQMLATVPDELEMSHVQLQQAQLGVQAEKAKMIQMGFNPDDSQSVQNYQLQDIQKVGSQLLNPTDPALTNAQKVIADPKASPEDKSSAWSQYVAARNAAQTGLGVEQKKELLASTQSLIAQRSDLFAKIAVNPKILDDPATQQELQRIAFDPDTTPEQRQRASQLVGEAKAANAQYLAQQEALAAERGKSYGFYRYAPFIDEQGNLVVDNYGDAAKRNLTPAQGGVKAMAQLAQIGDIRQGSDSLRTALVDNQGTQFTPTQVAKISVFESERDPAVLRNEIKNVAAMGLTPAQQDLVVSVLQMRERVLSIRNIAGMGQGSEQTRNAILATVPDITSGNTVLALKQLDAVDNLIDNLARGVPGVNVNRPIATGGVNHPNPNLPPLTNLHTNGKETIGWDGKQWVDTKTRKPYAPLPPAK